MTDTTTSPQRRPAPQPAWIVEALRQIEADRVRLEAETLAGEATWINYELDQLGIVPAIPARADKDGYLLPALLIEESDKGGAVYADWDTEYAAEDGPGHALRLKTVDELTGRLLDAGHLDVPIRAVRLHLSTAPKEPDTMALARAAVALALKPLPARQVSGLSAGEHAIATRLQGLIGAIVLVDE
jgi:hypothetical protein